MNIMAIKSNKLNPFVWVRMLYDWTLRWAEHHMAVPALCVLAFFESVFFPVPADVLLLAMGAAKPKKALYYAVLTSVFSVLGGCFGYLIGLWFWNLVGDLFFQYVFHEELFNKVKAAFDRGAFLAIFSAAFTPIPFKVFTIAAGVFEISFAAFFAGAVIGRPLRFLLVGGSLYLFGAKIKGIVEKHFELFTLLFTVLLVGGFLVVKWIL